MAADKTLFAPIPLRAMRAGLSGLQHDVLTCIAAHDRMSLVTGKGQGCRASNQRIAHMVGCHYARACSTLSELTERGFVQREKQGRFTVYRVIYNDDDKLLFGNVSIASEKGAMVTPSPGKDCQTASASGPMGCRGNLKSDVNSGTSLSQYIPLSGGKYSVETREDNSWEHARSARFATFCPLEWEACNNVGGELARLERAMKAGAEIDCIAWYGWLDHAIEHDDQLIRQWAFRLSEQLVDHMGKDEYARWSEKHVEATGANWF